MATHTISFTSISLGSATGTLTLSGQPNDTETVTIGTKVYTFQATLTNVDGHVHIGSDAANTATNLFCAINATGGTGENAKGTGYATASVADENVSAANGSSGVVTVTALSAGIAGNVVATETATNVAWDASTIAAGTLTGGEVITISAEDDTSITHSQIPAQQTTINNLSDTNARWSRRLRLTTSALFAERNLTDNVAVYVDSLVALSYAVVTDLTWTPVITTQPVAGTCAANSGHVDFTVVAVSEVPTDQTYAWKESADGTTYGSALTTTGIYDVSVAGTLTITPTAPTLTTDNTIPTNGKIVTLGGKVYTWVTGSPSSEGDVKAVTDGDTSLVNLIRAINHTGTPDTDYKCAAANTEFTADAALVGHVMTVRPIAGGTYTTTTDEATLSWTAASFTSTTGYYYRCDISNTAGTTSSTGVVLTVT